VFAQAFVRIYADPSNKVIATQKRAERYERMIAASSGVRQLA